MSGMTEGKWMPADCCGQGGQQMQNTEKQKNGQIYFQEMKQESAPFPLIVRHTNSPHPHFS